MTNLSDREQLKECWVDRFDEVVKGLEIDKTIANKLANFIHYEIETAKKNEVARLKEENEELRNRLQSEWLCENCNTIYPLQQRGKISQPCPRCKTLMIPTSPEMREIKQLQSQLSRMSKSAGMESIEKFLGERIDFPPKPNYLFVHKIYPSSGVDRMYKQQEQIRELAQAIHDSIMGVK